MSVFDIFRKKEAPLSNEDLAAVMQMLYRQINRDIPVVKIVNKTQFLTIAYAGNPTVYSIVNLRANAAKGIPWLVYKVKNQQKLASYQRIEKKDLNLHGAIKLKEQALDEVDSGPVKKLFDDPHPTMTWQDIIEAMFVYRDTTGDSYLYMVRNSVSKDILQFHVLPADKVEIIGGMSLDPVAGYVCGSIFDSPLPPDRVLHWKYFNPIWADDGRNLYGMSPLLAAAKIINSDSAGIDNEVASFANEGVKAILTGTENVDFNYSKQQMEVLLKRLRRATAKAKLGEGNIMFNRFPLNLVKIGETPVDLGVLTSRKYNKEVLCNVYRIHPSLVSSEASTLDNLKEARKALITMSVLPDMDNLRSHLNREITRSFGPGWFVDYDLMAISELQDDLEKLSKTLVNMDWITADEKRAATQYDEYVPGDSPAKILYTDMGKVPLGYGMDSSLEDIDNRIDDVAGDK